MQRKYNALPESWEWLERLQSKMPTSMEWAYTQHEGWKYPRRKSSEPGNTMVTQEVVVDAEHEYVISISSNGHGKGEHTVRIINTGGSLPLEIWDNGELIDDTPYVTELVMKGDYSLVCMAELFAEITAQLEAMIIAFPEP